MADEDVARCVARLIPTYLRIDTQRSPRTRHSLLSFEPPTAGMFFWMELYSGNVPNETDTARRSHLGASSGCALSK